MIFFTLLALFFGIPTPNSYQTLVLDAAVFGLLAQAQLKPFRLKDKITIWLLIMLGYGVLLNLQTDYGKTLAGLSVFSFTYWLLHRFKLPPQILTRIVLVGLGFGFGLAAYFDGSQLRAQLAQKISPPFMTDMYVYLNTVQEYKVTGDYYGSLADSLKGLQIHYGTDRMAGEIWGWKQPLIFTVWKILPGNTSAIQWLGVGVFSLALIIAYQIARVLLPPNRALIASFLLSPYLRYPLTEMTLLQVEWWALVFFLAGLAAYLRRRFWLTGIAFAFSLAIRELFAIPILGLVTLQLFQRRLKTALILSLPTGLFFLPYYYFYHLGNVFNYEPFDLFSPASLRQGAQNGWQFVQTTLAYNSWSYALWTVRPFLLLLIVNTIGLIVLIARRRLQRWEFLSLLASFLVFFLLSFKLGIMDRWHDYWGIYFVPLLLISASIVFSCLDEETVKVVKKLRTKASI